MYVHLYGYLKLLFQPEDTTTCFYNRIMLHERRGSASHHGYVNSLLYRLLNLTTKISMRRIIDPFWGETIGVILRPHSFGVWVSVLISAIKFNSHILWDIINFPAPDTCLWHNITQFISRWIKMESILQITHLKLLPSIEASELCQKCYQKIFSVIDDNSSMF